MNVLNYNEDKVKKGKAEGVHAENFLLDMDQMNFYDKFDRFNNQMALNSRAQTKLMHISLNFDPSEYIAKDELSKIASGYMEKIGFGDQPFLVYQHHDAGHPHIHIVTTTIDQGGNHINTHNIGKNESEKARKEIEIEFGLVIASEKSKGQLLGTKSVDAEKVKYGKSETKRSITNVLDAVIKQYKYTSLAELNAVLKLYNVVADRGKEAGRIHKTNGLVYRVLDENGNKIGVPIKASSIYSKPTLTELEKKFTENEFYRQPLRNKLKEKVENVIHRSRSIQHLITELKDEKIDVAIRRNDAGFIYGITFIDHENKTVFNGSDLGKQFSAAAIQQRLSGASHQEAIISPKQPDKIISNQPQSASSKSGGDSTTKPKPTEENQFENIHEKDKAQSKSEDLLEQLMQPEKTGNYIPYELRKKKKKKKKPKL